eukprot:scaffold178280_cov18-Tisochrysis_lutea.AAC.1
MSSALLTLQATITIAGSLQPLRDPLPQPPKSFQNSSKLITYPLNFPTKESAIPFGRIRTSPLSIR